MKFLVCILFSLFALSTFAQEQMVVIDPAISDISVRGDGYGIFIDVDSHAALVNLSSDYKTEITREFTNAKALGKLLKIECLKRYNCTIDLIDDPKKEQQNETYELKVAISELSTKLITCLEKVPSLSQSENMKVMEEETVSSILSQASLQEAN